MNKHEINPYLASLIVTVVGAGAAMMIIKVAYANVYEIIYVNNAAAYHAAFPPR
ncbi:MAG: hypothetical protein AAB442_03025 [Patescibacteria group bacterium]